MPLSTERKSLHKNADDNLLWQLLLQPHGALQQNPKERKIFVIVLYVVQRTDTINLFLKFKFIFLQSAF